MQVVKILPYVYIYHGKGRFCVIFPVTDIISRLRLGQYMPYYEHLLQNLE